MRKFDLSTINDDSVVAVFGKCGTGKTFLVKDLLYQNRDTPFRTVITQHETLYDDFITNRSIHKEEYTPSAIEKFVKRQRSMMDKHQTADPRALLVLEDCIFDNSWTKDTNLRHLFGHHLSVMLIITMQYPLRFPPPLQVNVDYLFVFQTSSSINMRLYKDFGRMFPSFDAFCEVINQCTDDFGCLVIDNNSKSDLLEDQIFWYKAEHRDLESEECGSKRKRLE